MGRGDVTDAEWVILGPLLPPERGRWGRPAQDNRRFLNRMLWILRTGSPWRDLPDGYGKWISVYQRFRRWAEQGVWDGLLETLVELGLTDDWMHMIDTTAVRAHSQAAGTKGGSSECSWPKPRRLYDKDPRPRRRSGTPSWLSPDPRRGLRLQGRAEPDRPPGGAAAGDAGRQGL